LHLALVPTILQTLLHARTPLPPPPSPPSCTARSHVRSHSWHDDTACKIDALRRWQAEFEGTHGRAPRVWLDALCLDVEVPQEALVCLPIFLAGSARFVALVGPTWVERLWCLVELSAFIAMGGDEDDVELIFLSCDAATGVQGGGALSGHSCAAGAASTRAELIRAELRREHAAKIASTLKSIKVGSATCSNAADRERLISTVEAGFGSLASYDEQISSLLTRRARAAGVPLGPAGEQPAADSFTHACIPHACSEADGISRAPRTTSSQHGASGRDTPARHGRRASAVVVPCDDPLPRAELPASVQGEVRASLEEGSIGLGRAQTGADVIR